MNKAFTVFAPPQFILLIEKKTGKLRNSQELWDNFKIIIYHVLR